MSANSFFTALTFVRTQSFRFLYVPHKTLVCSAPTENEETHHNRIFDACQTIRNRLGTFERVRRSMIRHVHAYTDSGEGYFGHLL